MSSVTNISRESPPSDGATQASARVTIELPWQGGILRFLAYDATARALVSARIGILEGANQWFVATSIPTTTMGQLEWGVSPIPPGATVASGERTFFIEPNAALLATRRLVVLGTMVTSP